MRSAYFSSLVSLQKNKEAWLGHEAETSWICCSSAFAVWNVEWFHIYFVSHVVDIFRWAKPIPGHPGLEPYTVNGLSYSLTLRNEKHNPFVGAALSSYLGLFSISVLNSIMVDPAMQAWTDRGGSSCHILWVKPEWDTASKQEPDLSCATWQHTDNRDRGWNSLSAFLSFSNLQPQGPAFCKTNSGFQVCMDIKIFFYYYYCSVMYTFTSTVWFFQRN